MRFTAEFAEDAEKERMPAIAMLTVGREQLGFLLIAGDKELAECGGAVDSVFLGVPSRSELFDHPLGVIIQDNKSVEQVCKVTRRDDGFVLTRPVTEAWELRMTLDNEGHGTFHFVGLEQTVGPGVCHLAASRS